jgi:hypothetical protein
MIMMYRALTIFDSPYLGGDPEFFFNCNGAIIGSEKVLPENGLTYDRNKKVAGTYDGAHTAGGGTTKIVRDGVQAELNPRPNTCRANLANEISQCFRQIALQLSKDVRVDFTPVVKVSEEEFASLSEKSKEFGCAPSKNIYGENKITVDAREYKYRSAGGHIHIGVLSNTHIKINKAIRDYERMVPLLDLIVGNTCVLIDRNPWNKERRKVYGRAGEHRTPAHGLEYRTLSNFWLQSYQLMSFVYGLTRLAVNIVANSYSDYEYDKELMNLVDKKDIVTAINENDFDLAMSNWTKIESAVTDMTDDNTEYPIIQRNLKQFHYFVDIVKEKGLNYWFKDDPFNHWTHLPEGHGRGWENFLDTTVKESLTKKLCRNSKLKIIFKEGDTWSKYVKDELSSKLLETLSTKEITINFFGYRRSRGLVTNLPPNSVRNWMFDEEHPLFDEDRILNVGLPKQYRQDGGYETLLIVKAIYNLFK